MNENLSTGPGKAIEPGHVVSDISRELVRLYSRTLGRGPTKARTTANTNTVIAVFHDTLTRAEMTLVEAGQVPTVMAGRQAIAEAMRVDASGIIESLTGRSVTAYVSGLDPKANVSAIVFILSPIDESGIVGVVPEGLNPGEGPSDGTPES